MRYIKSLWVAFAQYINEVLESIKIWRSEVINVLIFVSLIFLNFRANNNWHTNFASITKSNENSPQSNKKQRDIGESARDSLAYSCLLKNELLGTAIDDVKSVTDDRNENSVTTSAKRGLFKYQSPSKQVSYKYILFTTPLHYTYLYMRHSFE